MSLLLESNLYMSETAQVPGPCKPSNQVTFLSIRATRHGKHALLATYACSYHTQSLPEETHACGYREATGLGNGSLFYILLHGTALVISNRAPAYR